jgi:hypothetical protein
MRSATSNTLPATCGLLIGWGVLLYGTLSLADVRSRWSDLLCGPWGCTAPLEAVLACHGAWLLILGPALFALCRRYRSRRSRAWMAVGLLGAAPAGIGAGIATGDISTEMPSSTTMNLLRGIALQVFGLVDVPVVPLLLLSLAAAVAAVRARGTRARPAPAVRD